jgi:hypothetical protein
MIRYKFIRTFLSFQLEAGHEDLKFVKVIFHFSPPEVMETDEYASWVNRYG